MKRIGKRRITWTLAATLLPGCAPLVRRNIPAAEDIQVTRDEDCLPPKTGQPLSCTLESVDPDLEHKLGRIVEEHAITFAYLGAEWCGMCHRLGNALADIRDTQPRTAIVRIDTGTPNGPESKEIIAWINNSIAMALARLNRMYNFSPSLELAETGSLPVSFVFCNEQLYNGGPLGWAQNYSPMTGTLWFMPLNSPDSSGYPVPLEEVLKHPRAAVAFSQSNLAGGLKYNAHTLGFTDGGNPYILVPKPSMQDGLEEVIIAMMEQGLTEDQLMYSLSFKGRALVQNNVPFDENTRLVAWRYGIRAGEDPKTEQPTPLVLGIFLPSDELIPCGSPIETCLVAGKRPVHGIQIDLVRYNGSTVLRLGTVGSLFEYDK